MTSYAGNFRAVVEAQSSPFVSVIWCSMVSGESCRSTSAANARFSRHSPCHRASIPGNQTPWTSPLGKEDDSFQAYICIILGLHYGGSSLN